MFNFHSSLYYLLLVCTSSFSSSRIFRVCGAWVLIAGEGDAGRYIPNILGRDGLYYHPPQKKKKKSRLNIILYEQNIWSTNKIMKEIAGLECRNAKKFPRSFCSLACIMWMFFPVVDLEGAQQPPPPPHQMNDYVVCPILYENLYYKNCSDCSVSQSVRPSADISALKEISRNLGNHWCSQFFFSIFFCEIWT